MRLSRLPFCLSLAALTLILPLAACDDDQGAAPPQEASGETTDLSEATANTAPADAGSALPVVDSETVRANIPQADETQSSESPITVENAYAFAMAEGSRNGAAFMTVRNGSGRTQKLIGASYDGANATQLHETYMDAEDGTVMMRPINGLDIPPYGEVQLSPSGPHVMLMGVERPFQEGERFMLTLTFMNQGHFEFPVAVTAPGEIPSSVPPAPEGLQVEDDAAAAAAPQADDVMSGEDAGMDGDGEEAQ